MAIDPSYFLICGEKKNGVVHVFFMQECCILRLNWPESVKIFLPVVRMG
jgi:hypothetical protein